MSVTIYEDAGFQGESLIRDVNDSDLSNDFMGLFDTWNDEASSLIVHEGFTTFYEDIHFKGASWTLEPGEYDQGDMLAAGIPNDAISSLIV
jgi:hypothetical protein